MGTGGGALKLLHPLLDVKHLKYWIDNFIFIWYTNINKGTEVPTKEVTP